MLGYFSSSGVVNLTQNPSVNCEEMEGKWYVGVDVGTESVRAALVDANGRVQNIAKKKIDIFNPRPEFYMQSSDDIWHAVCQVVQDVTLENRKKVRGIGFTATCSLVVLSKSGEPLRVDPSGEDRFNVIMWLDHRAARQAESINRTRHPVLSNYGGQMSLENQPPKLLWLKQNMGTDWWTDAGHFFDLPDFLTWKASKSSSRSLCSLICKWGYRANEDGSHGWDRSFWDLIGLGDLTRDDCGRIGNSVLMPGTRCVAQPISSTATGHDFTGVPVATSLIDAHCGGIGLLGCRSESGTKDPMTSRLALICGTSTCHMAVSEKPLHVPGVWGPYYSAMVPGLWLSEGGQSASGKLLDHIIDTHPASADFVSTLSSSRDVHTELGNFLEKLGEEKGVTSTSHLTEDLHVWPDFHGNRSPVADPNLKGMVSGLTLSGNLESLAVLYLATIQALAYGTKHIIDTMTVAGHNFQSILVCGGLSKNQIFVRTLADVTGFPVRVPNETESVLVGAAILAACAAADFPNVTDAMYAMGSASVTISPNLNNKQYHDKKYKVFLKMLEDQLSYRKLMQ